MGLLNVYRRFRHTFGFGVHSALAFRVVTEVWRLKGYGYYGYGAIEDYLDNLAGEQGGYSSSLARLRREARLVLRLAAAFGVRRAWLGENVPEIYSVALKTLSDDMKIVENPPENESVLGVMNLLPGEDMNETRLKKAGKVLGQAGAILLINGVDGRAGREVFAILGEGLWLSGRHTQLLFCRKGMPKISYTLFE